MYLSVGDIKEITADTPVTVNVKFFSVAGVTYEDGTYTEGNVTIVVDSTEIEVVDNGICDAGQTYGNVKYAFVAMTEDGELDSKALTVKRQNYIDGNVYYKLLPSAGYTILSAKPVKASVEKNTAGGELDIYEYVLAPEGDTKEMALEITVKK